MRPRTGKVTTTVVGTLAVPAIAIGLTLSFTRSRSNTISPVYESSVRTAGCVGASLTAQFTSPTRQILRLSGNTLSDNYVLLLTGRHLRSSGLWAGIRGTCQKEREK